MNEPSRSVFEAGIYGIPTIISLKDKIEDVVTDGFNGLIVEEKSPDQIADAVLKLYKDHDLRIQMGKNSRVRFMKNNDSKNSGNAVYKVYTEIMNQEGLW